MSLFEDGSFTAALQDVVTIAGFRALPVLGYVIAARSVRVRTKLLVLVAALTLGALGGLHRLLPLPWLLALYAYFIVASACVPFVVRPLREGVVTRGGLFAASASVFLVLPGLFAGDAARAAALLIGWDLALSSFSYCVEIARSEADPKRSDCLFFLLVNPALVYTDRGERFGPPALERRGLVRTALGLMTLLGGSALLAPACIHIRAEASNTGPLPVEFLGLGGYVALRFLLEYARHSGLASLQIGLLRQLGHAVPERYLYPLLARSPADFWRRWNTYVGGWMMRYVFRPFVRRFGRAGRHAGVASGYAIGAAGTFAVTGLLHDVGPYLGNTGRVGVGFAAFSAVGVLVVAWAVVARALRSATALDHPWLARAEPLVARVSFWAIALGCASWLLD